MAMSLEERDLLVHVATRATFTTLHDLDLGYDLLTAIDPELTKGFPRPSEREDLLVTPRRGLLARIFRLA